jgi:molybdopterin synthase catalytic subunit
MRIRVQHEDFDAGAEITGLRQHNPRVGAVVAFVGTVRDLNEGRGVATLTLEHYPGMTEKSLSAIATEACSRWRLEDLVIIHRVGEMCPTDQIVLVAVASAHRGEAFAACEFLMDYLKTRAPFWKKEATPDGERWVEARDSDTQAADRWSA